MRKILVILFLISILSEVEGQRLRYKDVFPEIVAADEESALNMLKEYLAIEPENPQANFFLAKLYFNRFKNADVLTEYEKAIANAEQAKLRFLKSKLTIDEKEVKRNNEFYLNNKGTVLSWDSVSYLINRSMAIADSFLTFAPPIYKDFTNAVVHYDQAIKLYASLAGSVNSLDDLLLLYSQETDRNLVTIKVHYDSTMLYLNRYFEKIEKFPIGYSQKCYIRPINTFRLHGMVGNINFLNESIYVWDYTRWVDEVRKTSQSEVTDIKTKLVENDKKISEDLDELVKNPAGKEYVSLIDRQLIFNLSKFDQGSLPASLMIYKDNLRKLVLSEKDLSANDSSKQISAESKYIIYSEVINSIREADTLLIQVKSKNTKDQLSKHKEFVDQRYGGEAKLSDYINKEALVIKNKLNTSVGDLRKTVLQNTSISLADSGLVVIYKKSKLPAYITGIPEKLVGNTYYVTHRNENEDGSIYAAGVVEKKAGTLHSFIYKLRGGRIEWLNEVAYSVDSIEGPTFNYPGAMTLTREGVAVVIQSLNSENKTKNSFVYLNESGGQKMVITLEGMKDFPKLVHYNEESNNFVFVFRGKPSNNDITTLQNTTVLGVNGLGDVMWKQEINYAGDFVDMMDLSSGFVVVGNATKFSSNSSKSPQTTVPFVVKIGERGQVLVEKWMANAEGSVIVFVDKSSDSNMNLFGLKGNYRRILPKEVVKSTSSIHLLIDGMIGITSTNLN